MSNMNKEDDALKNSHVNYPYEYERVFDYWYGTLRKKHPTEIHDFQRGYMNAIQDLSAELRAIKEDLKKN